MQSEATGNVLAVAARSTLDLLTQRAPVVEFQTQLDQLRDQIGDPLERIELEELALQGLQIKLDQDERSDRGHPDISPLRSPTLADAPPTVLVTTEFDPLRNQAESYGSRLQEEGVPLSSIRFAGQIHTFFQLYGIVPACTEAIDFLATELDLIITASAGAKT